MGSKVRLLASILTVSIFASITFSAQAAEEDFSFYKRRTLLHSFTIQPNGKVKLAIVDADSTLRAMYKKAVPAHRPEQLAILPFVSKRIRDLNEQGYFVPIMSNQSDVGRLYSFEEAETTFGHTVGMIEKEGGLIHYIDFAEFRDGDRKPEIGMALRLAKYLKENFNLEVDWQNSVMIGDSAWMEAKEPKDGKPGSAAEIRPDGRLGFNYSNFDRLFAENLGIRFIEAADFFGWREYGVDGFHFASEVTAFYRKLAAVDLPSTVCAKKLK